MSERAGLRQVSGVGRLHVTSPHESQSIKVAYGVYLGRCCHRIGKSDINVSGPLFYRDMPANAQTDLLKPIAPMIAGRERGYRICDGTRVKPLVRHRTSCRWLLLLRLFGRGHADLPQLSRSRRRVCCFDFQIDHSTKAGMIVFQPKFATV